MKINNFFFFWIFPFSYFSRDLFISNQTECSGLCDGSYEFPYPGFLYAMSNLDNDSQSLSLQLVSDSYFIEEPLFFSQFFMKPDESNFLELKIKPYECSEDITIKCNKKIQIDLKSQKIAMIVAKNMIIQNIVWTGNNLPFIAMNQENRSSIACMSNLSQNCCDIQNLYNETNKNCFLVGFVISPRLASTPSSQNELKGLFQFIFDNSSLFIISNEFNYVLAVSPKKDSISSFYYLFGGTTLNNEQFNVHIYDSSFKNNYFIYGLFYFSGSNCNIFISESFFSYYNDFKIVDNSQDSNDFFIILDKGATLTINKTTFFQNRKHIYLLNQNLIKIYYLYMISDYFNDSSSFISLSKMINFNTLEIYHSKFENINCFLNESIQTIIKTNFYTSNTYNLYQEAILISGDNNNNVSFINCTMFNISNVNFLYMSNNSMILIKDSIFRNIVNNINIFIQIQAFNQLIINNLSLFDIFGVNGLPFCLFYLENTVTILNSTVKNSNQVTLFYGYQNISMKIVNNFFSSMICNNFPTLIFFKNWNIFYLISNVLNEIENFGQGGVINLYENNNINIMFTIFNNTNGYEGSILYMMSYNNLNMIQSLIYNIRTSLVAIFYGRQYNNTFYVLESKFSNINTIIFEQIFYGKITIISCHFYNISNEGTTNGVIISLNTNSLFNIYYSLIEFVYSVNGGTFDAIINSEINLVNVVFHSIFLDSGGIATLGNDNKMFVFNCSFIDISTISAGGLFSLQLSNSLEITESSIFFVSCYNKGSVIYLLNYNSLLITKTKSNETWSLNNGGFIFAGNNNTIKVSESYFNKLEVFGKGGFLFAQKINVISLENCQFSTMLAKEGGFLYLNFQNTFYAQNLTISNVEISFNGGIIYAFLANSINIKECKGLNLISNDTSAGFYLDNNNNLTIESSWFIDIIVSRTGGFLNSMLENEIILISVEMKNIKLILGGGATLIDLGRNINFQMNFSKFNDVYCDKDCTIFSFDSNNDVLLFNNTAFLNESSYYVKVLMQGKSNNSIILSKNSFEFKILNIGFKFLSISDSSSLSFYDSKILAITMSVLIYLNLNSIAVLDNLTYNSENQNIEEFFMISISSESNCTFRNFAKKSFFLISFKIQNSFLLVQNVKLNFNDFLQTGSNMTIFQSTNSKIIIKNSEFKTNRMLITLIYAFYSNLKLTKSSFSGFFSINHKGAIIYGSEIQDLKILYSSFFKNGGLFFIENTLPMNNYLLAYNNIILTVGGCFHVNSTTKPILNSSFISRNSSFSFNQAIYGGVNMLININNVILMGNVFKGNFVKSSTEKSKGGVSYFQYDPTNVAITVKIFDCVFNKNKAEIGGCSFFNIISPIFFQQKNVSYINNFASQYGQNSASTIHNIGFVDAYNTDINIKTKVFKSYQLNVTSGREYINCLVFIVGIDQFDNIAYQNSEPDGENLLSLVYNAASNSILNKNTINTSTKNGFICMNGPFNRLGLPIESSCLYEVQGVNPKNISNILYLTFNFQNCKVGEKLNSEFLCEPCPVNRYSLIKVFQNVSNICLPCPNIQFKCLGGTSLIPNPGYWRLNSQSTNFMICPIFDNCLGGALQLNSYQQKHSDYSLIFNTSSLLGDELFSKTGFCSLGYAGILCKECDLGYGKTGSICRQCKQNGYMLWVSFQLILKLGVFFYSLHVATDSAIKEFMKKKQFKNICETNLIKILMNYLQILNLVFNYVDLNGWTIDDILSFSLGIQPNIGEAFSVECWLKINNWKIKPIIFQFYISMFYWIPLIFLCSIYLVIMKNNAHSNFSFKPMAVNLKYIDLIKSSLLIIMFLCYFDIMSICLKMFPCFNVGDSVDPEMRLVFDYSVQCKNEELVKIQFLSSICILVFGIGYPFFIFYVIYFSFKRRNLYSSVSLLKYSFFFRAYETNFFFWDILNMFKKLSALCIQILLASSLQIDNNISLQVLLLLILLFLLLQIKMRPYLKLELDVINELEQLSLMALSVTIYIVLLYNSLTFDQINTHVALSFTFLSFAILINLFFCCYWLYKYIPDQKQKVLEYYSEIKEKIRYFMKKSERVKTEQNIKRKNCIISQKELSNDSFLETRNMNPEFFSFKMEKSIQRQNLILFNDLRNLNSINSIFSLQDIELTDEDLTFSLKLNDEFLSNSLYKRNLFIYTENIQALICGEGHNHFDYIHERIDNNYFATSFFKAQRRIIYTDSNIQIAFEIINYEKLTRLMTKFQLKLIKINPLYRLKEVYFEASSKNIF